MFPRHPGRAAHANHPTAEELVISSLRSDLQALLHLKFRTPDPVGLHEPQLPGRGWHVHETVSLVRGLFICTFHCFHPYYMDVEFCLYWNIQKQADRLVSEIRKFLGLYMIFCIWFQQFIFIFFWTILFLYICVFLHGKFDCRLCAGLVSQMCTFFSALLCLLVAHYYFIYTSLACWIFQRISLLQHLIENFFSPQTFT